MRNPSGATHHPCKEWGKKNRKYEDRERGINNTARRDAIADQEDDEEE